MTPIFEGKKKPTKKHLKCWKIILHFSGKQKGKGPINSFWSLESPAESKPDSGRCLERASHCWALPSPSCHPSVYRLLEAWLILFSVSTKGRVKAFRPPTCNSFPVYKILLQFQHNKDQYRCLKIMPLVLKRLVVSKEHFILQNRSQTTLCKSLAWISDPDWHEFTREHY